jgi:isoleucyl-tRNA synthetase
MGPDKIAAYQTLYTALETLAKLLAPFTPFLAERIYLNLNGISGLDSSESVHLADFPKLDIAAIDRPLEQRMKKAQIITSLVRTMREKASIKVRQPLKRILLAVADASSREEYALVSDIILEEINVQKIEYIEDEGSVISKKVKPNFKTLGPRFGKEMKALAEAIRVMSHKQIALLEKQGRLSLELDGKVFELLREDVEVMHEDIEGWLVASDEANGIMVALDTEMTEELEMQGLSRELVSRIQALRKESGLDITDRIALTLEGSEKVLDAVKSNESYIKAETLAITLATATLDLSSSAKGKEETVNGEICRLSLEKYES